MASGSTFSNGASSRERVMSGIPGYVVVLFSGQASGCFCLDGKQTPVKFSMTGALKVDRVAGLEARTLRFTEGGYLRLAGDE